MDLSELVKEWVAVRENIQNIRGGLKSLTNREKELKTAIKRIMLDSSIDIINLRSGGKVTLNKKTSKQSITGKVLESGLDSFFSGDSAKVESVMEAIEAHREEKNVVSVSIRQPTKKKEGP